MLIKPSSKKRPGSQASDGNPELQINRQQILQFAGIALGSVAAQRLYEILLKATIEQWADRVDNSLSNASAAHTFASGVFKKWSFHGTVGVIVNLTSQTLKYRSSYSYHGSGGYLRYDLNIKPAQATIFDAHHAPPFRGTTGVVAYDIGDTGDVLACGWENPVSIFYKNKIWTWITDSSTWANTSWDKIGDKIDDSGYSDSSTSGTLVSQCKTTTGFQTLSWWILGDKDLGSNYEIPDNLTVPDPWNFHEDL